MLHWQPRKLLRCCEELWMKNRFVEMLYNCIYQEAIERKEKRARRFHFCGEESSRQRTILLDKDMMKQGERLTESFLKPATVTQVFSGSIIYFCLLFCCAKLYPGCVWRQSTWQVSMTWARRMSLDILRNILQHILSGLTTHPVSVSHKHGHLPTFTVSASFQCVQCSWPRWKDWIFLSSKS